METAENTLMKINTLLDFDKDSEEAIMYGVNKGSDGELNWNIIKTDGDVYGLITDVAMDMAHANYNYAVLKTTGWAAPLDENGNVNGAPSAHPKRRRVRLFVIADIDNNNVVGSALTFEDDPSNPIFDLNEATGSLAEAMNELLG